MKIGITESQTIGTPTEIYEALHVNKMPVVIIGDEPKTVAFKIENYRIVPELFRPPLTRKERRKLNHKK